jgi:hypothetical protein
VAHFEKSVKAIEAKLKAAKREQSGGLFGGAWRGSSVDPAQSVDVDIDREALLNRDRLR